MKSKCLVSIGMVCAVLFSPVVLAEHVFPQFSGAWYTDTELQYVDACSQPSFTYNNKSVTTPVALADKVLTNVATHTNCKWSGTHLTKAPDVMPLDFPGTLADWMMAKINSETSLKAERNCVSATGKIIDTKFVYLYPAYVCPTASRYGFDKKNHAQGCTTTPTVCNADVLGRELAVYGGHRLGHLAMTRGYDENEIHDQVLEVLKNTSDEIKITLSPIETFKTVEGAAYWGEKFGLTDVPALTDDDAYKILNAGMEQMVFPFNYTLTWSYHPGSYEIQSVYNQQTHNWENVYSVTNAKFRCDSFVYYSYVTGADLHIMPEFSFPNVPKDFFAAMMTCRDKEGAVCGTNPNLAERTYLPPSQPLAVLFAKDMDFKTLDAATERFVKDQNIPRTIKLNELWNLALKYQTNPAKFSYLMDCLAYLKPVELIPELITHYSSQNKANQFKLLATIISSLQTKNEQVENIVQGQNFIRELLLQTKDKTQIQFIMQMYSSVMPAEQVQQDLPRILSSTILSVEQKNLLTVQIAFSTKENQRKLLANMLNTDTTFNNSLCFILKNMPSSWIDGEVKNKLEQLLRTNKQNLLQSASKFSCNWLSAYATVMTNNEKEKNDFMLNYIRNEQDTSTQAKLLSQLNTKLAKTISVADKAYYRTRFNHALQNSTLSAGSKHLLMQGISSLYHHE